MVSFNNTNTMAAANSSSPITVSKSVTAGGNKTVAFAMLAWDSDATSTVSSVTYGGQTMTSAGAAAFNSTTPQGNSFAEIFYLVNPPTGSNNLVVTWSGTSEMWVGFVSFNGVDQVNPVRPGSYGTKTGQDPQSLVISSDPNDITISVCDCGFNGVTGTNQTQDGSSGSGNYEARHDHCTTRASSVTHTWGTSSNNSNIAIAGFSIKADIPSLPAPNIITRQANVTASFI